MASNQPPESKIRIFNIRGLPDVLRGAPQEDVYTVRAASLTPSLNNTPSLVSQMQKKVATRKLAKHAGFFTDRYNANRLLCDSLFYAKALREKPILESITKTKQDRAAGSYGIVRSAEILVRNKDGKRSMCIAAVKDAKIDREDQYNLKGFYYSILTELAIYNRIRNFKHAAKCMYVKLTHDAISYVMENYVGDVRSILDLFPVPSKPTGAVSAEKMDMYTQALADIYKARAALAKAIIFQAAHGLQEFHQNNIINKNEIFLFWLSYKFIKKSNSSTL